MVDRTSFSMPNIGEPEEVENQSISDEEIIKVLMGYKSEAKDARESGHHGGRDEVWKKNIDLYWGKFDWSQKLAWQSKEAMPDPQQIVDRFAATMKEALNREEKWFDVENKADIEGDLKSGIKKFMQIQLDRCGRNPTGQSTPFANVFERIMKMAAMMAACSEVQHTVDPATGKGFTQVIEVDPREVYLDPTGRNLYRLRQRVIDMHELASLAEMKDSEGNNLYDMDMVNSIPDAIASEEADDKKRISGHSQERKSTSRKTVTLDEYLCTLVDEKGKVHYRNHLFIVANDKFLIRGPEENPFSHGQDWINFCPVISVPFSVYGKSYMENWSSVARVFTEVTNLMLDAMFITSIKSYAISPDALKDPTQAEEGFRPGKEWHLEDDADIRNFIKEIDLGTVPPSLITSWQLLQKLMREGASFNEISLGRLASGEKTATEIQGAEQGSSVMMTAMAEWIETGYLEPELELIFKTGLQHLDKDDEEMRTILGEPIFEMLLSRKDEFIKQKFLFRVRGISNLVEKSTRLRKLLSAIQAITQNEGLSQQFIGAVDQQKLLAELFDLIGFDFSRIKKTERTSEIDGIVDTQNAAATAAAEAGAAPPNPNTDPVNVAQQLSQIVSNVSGNGGGQ